MVRKILLVMLVVALSTIIVAGAVSAEEETGVDTANGWYEGEEIYYLALGVEEGVSKRGQNQIYLIGGDRLHQAQVVLHVPGERDYSPHWNVNLVNTVGDVTVQEILDAGFGSDHFPEALFDDVEDILDAEAAGLVTIARPGVVVLCPIVSEKAAEAPGNNELGISDPFAGWDDYNRGF